MRVSIVLGSLCTLALAGCHSGNKVTADNASIAEVAQKVKASGVTQDNFIQPGRWEMTMTMKSIEVPGMPPEAAKNMQASMGKPRVIATCVTPEQAKKPKEDFFAGKEMKECRYEHFSMGDGKVDMVMHCNIMGQKRVTKMSGTYGPGFYHMDMESDGEGGEKGPGQMSMKSAMDAKHVGACNGTEMQSAAPK